ncbi:MAG: dihydrofolate reductase [Anaerolineales bacterium]|jgi:dihydrofolate reductase
MILSLIVAMDEEDGIGRDNQIPWHLSADLRRFKQITMGHCIIMGRRTYESIGRPLPGRTSIVITHQKDYQAKAGVICVDSLQDALQTTNELGETEAFIIGGGEIFQHSLPLADKIYLTRVHTRIQADTFFPPIRFEEWLSSQECFQPADEKNQYPSTFMLLKRKNRSARTLQ